MNIYIHSYDNPDCPRDIHSFTYIIINNPDSHTGLEAVGGVEDARDTLYPSDHWFVHATLKLA